MMKEHRPKVGVTPKPRTVVVLHSAETPFNANSRHEFTIVDACATVSAMLDALEDSDGRNLDPEDQAAVTKLLLSLKTYRAS